MECSMCVLCTECLMFCFTVPIVVHPTHRKKIGGVDRLGGEAGEVGPTDP